MLMKKSRRELWREPGGRSCAPRRATLLDILPEKRPFPLVGDFAKGRL
jgi:hypothetical protein